MVSGVIEYVEHPFGKGALTSNGVQWSGEKTTSTDGFESVEEVIVKPPALGAVTEFEFGLTCAVKSTGALEAVVFKWQARNKGGTWRDLHGEVTYAADASGYREYTYSGRVVADASFNSVPFELRLLIKSGGIGGENAVGKTKGSSYVRVIYSVS